MWLDRRPADPRPSGFACGLAEGTIGRGRVVGAPNERRFDLVRRDGPNHWTLTHDLPVGDLREDAAVTQDAATAAISEDCDGKTVLRHKLELDLEATE